MGLFGWLASKLKAVIMGAFWYPYCAVKAAVAFFVLMITFPFRLSYTVCQGCWVLTNGVGNLVLERLRSALPFSRGENSGKHAHPCSSRFISAHTITTNKATNTPATNPTATKVQKGTGNVEPADPGLEGFCFISHIKHGGTVQQSGRVMLGDQLVRIDGLDCLGRAQDDVNRRVLGTPCAQDTDIVLGFKRAGQDSYEVILRRTFQKATAAPQIVEDTSEREDKEGSKKKYRFAGLSPVQREIMRRIKPTHDTQQLKLMDLPNMSSRTQKDENARMDREREKEREKYR